MANGDKAAAAGMDVVPGTADLRHGYDEDNKTRDYLADHMTTGSHTQAQIIGLPARLTAIEGDVNAVEAEVDGVRTLAQGKQNALGFVPVQQGGGTGMTASKVRIGWSGVQLLAQVDNVPLGPIMFGGAGQDVTFGHIYSPPARSTPATVSYVAAYINGDGRIAGGASSRRFKKEIGAWSPDKQAVLAMQLVTFRYKAAVYGSGDAPVEVGMIAEELHDLGLEWLVFYDDEGLPQGIHYDRIALALLPVVQDHEARLTALEAKLEGGE